MSEKYIPNSYQTPNVLVDEIMPLLTPIEWCVLSFAIRHILGWQDRIASREAEISLTRFESIGISRPAIISALSELETYKLLTKVGISGTKGQRWHLGFDEGVNFEGLQKRFVAKKEAGVKRSEKARSVGLTSQSGLPGAVSRTDRSSGQSDLHNETQGIQTQDQTLGGYAKAPALKVPSANQSKGKYTPDAWYAVHDETKRIGLDSYDDETANTKRPVWEAKGYRLVLGCDLNIDPLYKLYKQPRPRKVVWEALTECGFGIKPGANVPSTVAKRASRLVDQVADCEQRDPREAELDPDLAADVYSFFKAYKESRPTADLPINDIGPSWMQWRNGLLTQKTPTTAPFRQEYRAPRFKS